MLTNCLVEKHGKCIPIDISSCEKCQYFELDPEKCDNYNTKLCLLEKGSCPCKNWARKP